MYQIVGEVVLQNELKQLVQSLNDDKYSIPWWKVKEIDWVKKSSVGQCPLTLEETALTLQALGIHRNTLIYVAAGEIYGAKRRMVRIKAAFPNLVSNRYSKEARKNYEIFCAWVPVAM